jgi:hypothetical protein
MLYLIVGKEIRSYFFLSLPSPPPIIFMLSGGDGGPIYNPPLHAGD